MGRIQFADSERVKPEASPNQHNSNFAGESPTCTLYLLVDEAVL